MTDCPEKDRFVTGPSLEPVDSAEEFRVWAVWAEMSSCSNCAVEGRGGVGDRHVATLGNLLRVRLRWDLVVMKRRPFFFARNGVGWELNGAPDTKVRIEAITNLSPRVRTFLSESPPISESERFTGSTW